MTISNGSVIVEADLDGMLSTALGLVQADAALLPAGLELPLRFDNLVDSTDPSLSRSVFVVPEDCYLESVAVVSKDMTASSTLTVDVTGDGAIVNWPTQVAGTLGSGLSTPTRSLFNGTKQKLSRATFALQHRAFTVFPRGSTITVALSTTSTATPSSVQVTLVLRSFFGRSL